VFFFLPRITKNLLKINDAIENFMIFCTNQDLTIKTRKSYESTLKLFAKFLEEEHDITAMEYTGGMVEGKDGLFLDNMSSVEDYVKTH
jgi:hypothetical protein